MTSRAGSYYWQPYQSETFAYTNNRHNGWSYYADGQVSSSPATPTDDAHSFYYDAAGRLSRTIDTATNRTVDYRPSYDGDGKLASEWSQTTVYGYPDTATSYVVRSTVIGEVLTRLDQSGNKTITHVPAEGLLFATQETSSGLGPFIRWTQRNPLGITETGKGVYDPLGNYIPFQQHNDPRPPAGSYSSASMSGLSVSTSNANDYGMGCFVDGVPMNCNRAMAYVNTGVVQVRSIVSGNGNGMGTQLGLTFEQRYVRVNGELQLGAYRLFLRNLAPGGQPSSVPNPQNSSTIPLGDLKSNLQALLKKGDCEKYTTALLAEAAKQFADSGHLEHINTLMEGYNMISAQGDYVLKQIPFDTVGGDLFNGGTNVNAGPGTVLLVPNRLYRTPTAKEIAYYQADYAWTALHETLHLGKRGWYSDQQLAEAAYSFAGLSKPMWNGEGDKVSYFSNLLDQELKKHCPHPQQ